MLKNIAIKAIIGFSNFYCEADKKLKEKTGKGLVERQTAWREREEKEKKENPVKWASKKLLEGTLKGIIGGTISSSK